MRLKSLLKCSLVFYFLFSFEFIKAQTIEEASAFFMHNMPDSALITAKKIIDKDKQNPDAYGIAGRSLVAMKNYKDAIYYLEYVKSMETAPAYAKAWAMHDLGLCYFSKGDYQTARENLLQCIALNATRNVNASARKTMYKLGFDNFYSNWSVVETPHFVFHFQDTLSKNNVSPFTKNKEACFDSINSFFKATLPKKIDYFVWQNAQEADSIFKHELAFTESSLCCTHTDPNHTLGHEMTHSISYHAVETKFQSKLIAEGVCVYFDRSKRNNIDQLRKTGITTINLKEIWQNGTKRSDELLYPLGAELVKRLIALYGREKFMQLLMDQRYENARFIYGDQLDKLLLSIESEVSQ